MNVFVVEGPFQLLNALEAREYFGFADNHLVIILGLGHNAQDFRPLICEKDWDTIRYVKININPLKSGPRFLGESLSKKVRDYLSLCRQGINRARLDRLARRFSRVDNIILGNYLQNGCEHLRHFANVLGYKNLYLVDDGTDVIKVNDERKKNGSMGTPGKLSSRVISPFKGVKRVLRESFVEWNEDEAGRVTFFTVYNLDVRHGDQVVKNDYVRLRRQLVRTSSRDCVLFLGQCLIEDNYMEKDVYFEYMHKVKSYFVANELVYIPHPRESSDTVEYIRKRVGLRIEQPNIPIEFYLGLSDGYLPDTLASFFCSALMTCAVLYGGQIKIKAFHIDPKHILHWT